MVNIDGYLGHGAIYHYDALGSFERVMASCAGKGEHLIQPILGKEMMMMM